MDEEQLIARIQELETELKQLKKELTRVRYNYATSEQKQEIYEAISTGAPVKEIAQRFNKSSTRITQIYAQVARKSRSKAIYKEKTFGLDSSIAILGFNPSTLRYLIAAGCVTARDAVVLYQQIDPPARISTVTRSELERALKSYKFIE